MSSRRPAALLAWFCLVAVPACGGESADPCAASACDGGGGSGATTSSRGATNATATSSHAATTGSGEATCPPTPATAVSATSTSWSSIRLTWKGGPDDSGFRIERRSTHGTDPYVEAGTVDGATFAFDDTGLNAMWEYTYRVIALGPGACQATPSDEVVAQVLGPSGAGGGGAGGSTGAGGSGGDGGDCGGLSRTPLPASRTDVNPGDSPDTVKAKVEACANGFVYFHPGSYTAPQIAAHDHCTIAGDGATLTSSGGDALLVLTGSHDVRVEGLTLRGKGVLIDNLQGPSDGLVFFQNTFDDVSIFGPAGITGAQIVCNDFENRGSSVSTYGNVTVADTRISYNSFHGSFEAVHLFCGFQGTSHDISVDHNTIRGATRHAIEIQQGCRNLDVTYNDIADWNTVFWSDDGTGPDHSPCKSGAHMALSIATGGVQPDPKASGGQNIHIAYNKLDMAPPSAYPESAWYCMSALELMGNCVEVDHNTITDWGNAALTYLSTSSPGGIVTYNLFLHDNTFVDVGGSSGGAPPAQPWTANSDGTCGW